MILPIYLYGHPVLRKQSIDVEPDYPRLKNLIADMFETMYKADGVGLAASQIGKNINIFIVDASPLAQEKPELKDFKRVFINPQITFLTDEKYGIEEGCLSIPNIHEFVLRPKELEISYFNDKFESITETFNDHRAIVIQHEYDHLKGILFVDKISPIKRRLLQSKLNNISKGKVDVDYKIKF